MLKDIGREPEVAYHANLMMKKLDDNGNKALDILEMIAFCDPGTVMQQPTTTEPALPQNPTPTSSLSYVPTRHHATTSTTLPPTCH